MGIEDYRNSAKYRRRIAADYRTLFPHLTEPDENTLSTLNRKHIEQAYEARLRQVEKFMANDRKELESQKTRLAASFQHLQEFIDARDAHVRRTGSDPLREEQPANVDTFKSVFLRGTRRSQLVAIGGGKGGIGKTLVTSNLAIALATMGRQVVAVDMDLGGADLHLSLGIRNLSRSLNDFIERKFESLDEVRLATPYRNLTLIATDSSRLGAANIKFAHKEKILRHLGKIDCDVILVDLGAEVSFNVLDIFLAADHRYVVTSTEPTSVLEAYGLIKLSLFRKLRHFANEMIAPHSELGEVFEEFLFERDAATNGKPKTVWQLVEMVGKTDPEMQKILLKMIWGYQIDLVVNMSEAAGDASMAQTSTRLAQDNLSRNVQHAYVVPWDRKVRECAKRLLPITVEDPSGPAAKALIKIATDSSYMTSTKEEISERISKIAVAAKERMRKMGELSVLDEPNQPLNKIVPLEEEEKPQSRLRAFLNKEIRLRK